MFCRIVKNGGKLIIDGLQIGFRIGIAVFILGACYHIKRSDYMLSIKVIDVVPLADMQLLVFFEDGKIKKFDVKPIIKDYPEFAELQNPDIFNLVQIEPGGCGISWTADLDCSKQNIDDLIRRGKLHPVKVYPKSKLFLKSEVVKRTW